MKRGPPSLYETEAEKLWRRCLRSAPDLPIGASLGRDVAQPGSASHWGCGGRRFESSRPDQYFNNLAHIFIPSGAAKFALVRWWCKFIYGTGNPVHPDASILDAFGTLPN